MVKMDEFPIELMEMIVSFSSRDDFGRLSAVSRTWQSVTECHTMRKINLKSPDLQDFARIFAPHNRRAALKKLVFDVVLPSYSDDESARFETHQDKQRNSEVLSYAVHSLMSILHSWDEDVRMLDNETASYQRPVTTGHISLVLKAYSLSDEGPTLDEARGNSLAEERWARSFLRISKYAELPTVSRIWEFKAVRAHFRHIEGASLAGVAAKLPNLENITWFAYDDDKIYPAMRQQRRFDFARSLATLPIQSLTRVKLNFCSFTPRNQHVEISSALMASAPLVDHLSLALHTLSQSPNLTNLYLGGTIVLSPCFFWPLDHADPTPFWPHLQDLIVELSITTPEGNWLYKRGPGDTEYYGDDGEENLDPPTLPDLLELENLLKVQPGNWPSMHLSRPEVPYSFENERLQSLLENMTFNRFPTRTFAGRNFAEYLILEAIELMEGLRPTTIFRKTIDSERLDPMLMAMARAARHMPALQDMRLSLRDKIYFREIDSHALGDEEGDSRAISVCLAIEKGTAMKRKKRWRVAIGESNWKVPDKLVAAWKNVGIEDDSDVVIEYVSDEALGRIVGTEDADDLLMSWEK